MARFDALLFDAGGVLVLPDPMVLGPLLARYGGSTDVDRHRRAHYAAMKAKSDANEPEGSWQAYDDEYVERVGVAHADRTEASFVLGRTRTAWLWRWMIPETRVALESLSRAGVPLGVVSNASGQI
jgi:phosphoglycolate phosphatase-like HAD superfamily hydrolase